MHPRTPARHRTPLVCDERGSDGHHSQEGGPGGTCAASDARSYRLYVTPSFPTKFSRPSRSRGGEGAPSFPTKFSRPSRSRGGEGAPSFPTKFSCRARCRAGCRSSRR
jgi:hypothetical protein